MDRNVKIAKQLLKLAKSLVSMNIKDSQEKLLPMLDELKKDIVARGGEIVGKEESMRNPSAGWRVHFKIEDNEYDAILVNVATGFLKPCLAFYKNNEEFPEGREFFDNVDDGLNFIFQRNKDVILNNLE